MYIVDPLVTSANKDEYLEKLNKMAKKKHESSEEEEDDKAFMKIFLPKSLAQVKTNLKVFLHFIEIDL